MYYDREVEAKAPKTGGISMGPFYITQEQVSISFTLKFTRIASIMFHMHRSQLVLLWN